MSMAQPITPTGNERPAARSGDVGTHGAAISGGSLNVFIEGRPAARVGDPIVGSHCSGAVLDGSKTVFINGLPVARLTDPIACTGVIVTGAINTLIG
jgi:uncharacterized Zn-binding protein involved in type VI secretion